MRELRFGIIGLGLMGREFASLSARWFHLLEMNVKPVITAVCDTNEKAVKWFTDNLPSINFTTANYHELLARDDVDAVYCAVPHNLHQQFYTDIIKAGKHLLGEKPFGIDKVANDAINKVIAEHPNVLVRCSSEFPFFPGSTEVIKAIRENSFGRIIEVEAGLLHSSDMNPTKPINWKRMVHMNGEYGCMGDLGMHVVHIPARFNWKPQNISARLSNIVTERPDGKGNIVPCETWDNATITGDVSHDGYTFPMTLHTKRIAPSETNTWFIRVLGMKRSMEFSSKLPKTLKVLDYNGGVQAWQHIDLGYTPPYPTITGNIFEFSFSDSLLQMFAAFCDEAANGREGMKQPFYCATPEEAAESHRIFTESLLYHERVVVKG
jgi:predicted dehydrogenase